MRARSYVMTVAAILVFMLPLVLWGQEEPKSPEQKPQSEPAPLPGSFETEGSLNFGYRFVTQKGNTAEYNDLFNLHQGFRLMDLNLTGRAPEGSHAFADFYSITASGLGGDPYQGGQLTLRKDKLYDLRVNYRQMQYNWSQNNN